MAKPAATFVAKVAAERAVTHKEEEREDPVGKTIRNIADH